LLRNPGLTTVVDGKNRSLYMPSIPSLEEATKPNLKKKLPELGLQDGHQIVIGDVTSPKPIIAILKYNYNME
jgi:ubiquitin-activating enzyme E1 C